MNLFVHPLLQMCDMGNFLLTHTHNHTRLILDANRQFYFPEWDDGVHTDYTLSIGDFPARAPHIGKPTSAFRFPSSLSFNRSSDPLQPRTRTQTHAPTIRKDLDAQQASCPSSVCCHKSACVAFAAAQLQRNGKQQNGTPLAMLPFVFYQPHTHTHTDAHIQTRSFLLTAAQPRQHGTHATEHNPTRAHTHFLHTRNDGVDCCASLEPANPLIVWTFHRQGQQIKNAFSNISAPGVSARGLPSNTPYTHAHKHARTQKHIHGPVREKPSRENGRLLAAGKLIVPEWQRGKPSAAEKLAGRSLAG